LVPDKKDSKDAILCSELYKAFSRAGDKFNGLTSQAVRGCYALPMAEIKDVRDTEQYIVFIRGIHCSLQVHEVLKICVV